MTEGDYLDVAEFSEAAGISRQAAWKAVVAATIGRPWRGHTLVVRKGFGRGGRSGLHYEVSLRSVQAALEAGSKLAAAPPNPSSSRSVAPAARPTASDQGSTVAARWAVIEAAARHTPESQERAAALMSLAERAQISLRTIQRWLKLYDAYGMSGLARRRPADAGKARVWVSRPFDRAFLAAGHSPELLAEIGRAVAQEAKRLWASRAEASGGDEVRRLLEFRLSEFCEERRVELATAALQLSRRHVERFSEYRVVNRYRNDRKAFDDAKPRIRRHWTSLAPMEVVIADVKPVDVIVTRPDGSPAWPRLIAFMDAGTGRIFTHLVLCPKGEGIRQEHVFEAFIAMTQDAEWGFPHALYLDNGSEFGGLDKLRVALELVSNPNARTIIYAKPYNASAKPIESLFARLDRYVFAQMPGHAGGERMHKKTQTVGKPPAPYPGSWENFCETLATLIKDFNERPVRGQWLGKSPNQWLRDKHEAGWRPIHVDPLILDAAFCDSATRRVSKGCVSIGGETYHHPELSALPARTEVSLALPWRRGGDPLFRPPGGGWAYLERDRALPAMWLDGARETARRQSGQKRMVARLAKEAPPADPLAIKARMVKRAPPPIAIGRPDRLDAGAELRTLADGRANPPTQANALSEDEARRRRRDAQIERLLRAKNRVA